MQILKSLSGLLVTIVLALISCSPVPSTPIPRIPEVIKTVGIRLNSDGHGLVAVNTKTGYVYVSAIQRITIFKDAEILSVLKTEGEDIVSMAVDETRDLVYVVNQHSDSVSVIHGSEVIGTVPTVGHMPRSVAVEPQSGIAYVVSGHRKAPPNEDPVEGNVLVLSSTRIVANIKASERVLLTQIVVDPVGGYVYAGDVSGRIIVINGLQEVAHYDLTRALAAMDVNSRTGEVYVYTDSRLSKFRAGQLLGTVEVSERPIFWSQLRVHPVTENLYITAGGQEEGHVLVLNDMTEIANIKVGGGAKDIAFDATTQNVYVTNFEEDTVTVINGTQILATIKVGWYPYGIGVTPANGWVYVSNINDGTVTILGYPEQKTNGTQPSTKPYP